MSSDNTTPDFTRRPIRARDTRWAPALALWLARRGVRPNAVSVASVVFALLAGAALAGTRWATPGLAIGLFVAAALLIPLRLLCNLLDGLIAVEGGFSSPAGEIYNEFPDRLSDAFVLVGAGYALGHGDAGITLGWTAAVVALLVAYIRTLGSSAGARAHFEGPLAKQQRMVVLVAGALVAALEVAMGWEPRAVAVALGIVIIGGLVTLIRRTRLVVRDLNAS